MNLQFRPIPLVAATGWLVTATILFCLPGSALPSASWFSTLQVDKWVHVGIFFLLCVLWSLALQLRTKKQLAFLALAAFVYGSVIELVQHNFIVNRSFDVFDIAADMVGAIVAGVWRGYIKNKPL